MSTTIFEKRVLLFKKITENNRKDTLQILPKILGVLAGINVTCIIIVISSLFFKTSVQELKNTLISVKAYNAIYISVCSIFFSLIIIVILGIPIAYWLSNNTGKSITLVECIFSIPIILPPSVTGLALLMTFGSRGVIGKYLTKLEIEIPFTFSALVLLQVFVTLPYFIQIVKNGFCNINPSYKEAAIALGAGERHLLTSIYIPVTLRTILSALIICTFRAAGEFGATIMFAGNLENKTQTITTRIYTLYQIDIYQSVSLAVIQILIFILPLLLLKFKLEV